ncbi:MAG TPA: hypothetical protein VGZ71_16055, partial [Puia sp.]|nr:hypothetical protein [Puia sp.]
ENDSVIQIPLPPVYDLGYVMALTEPDKDHLLISVSTNVPSSNQRVYLFGHTRNMIKLAQTKPVINGRSEFLIDKNILGEGVSHLTVFNGDRQPVCERLYFKRPTQKMALEVRPGRPEYGRREKVSIDLSARDPSGLPLAADFSVSVYMTDSLQAGGGENILSYLWLVSDLKGVVESPEYYFGNPGAEADEAIENLLLTQGWRRFRWEDLLQNNKPSFEFIPEYDGHIVTGKIIDKRSGMPAENIPTYLSIPGQKFKLHIATSNQKGQIHFDVKNFSGGGEMVVQTNTRTDSIFRIDISNPFDEKPPAHPSPAFELSEKWAGLLNFRSMHAQLQNNFTRPAPPPPPTNAIFSETADSTAFYGNPDKKYFLDDYTRFVTMEEVMREYVAEVRVSKRRDKFHFEVMNLPYRLFLGNDPLVLMDGVPVFDINRIIDFDPLKIKKLEIVARRYFLDSVMNDGIVSYTTYQGNLAGFQLDPNALILEYPGTQPQPEYYSPVYETSSQSASRLPDFRNLLYWSPQIKTDGEGKDHFSFYTSDLPGKYVIVVQGITDNGFAGSSTTEIRVNK